MELIAITAFLTFANIGGVAAVTEQMPDVANRGPVPFGEDRPAAPGEGETPTSLVAAIRTCQKKLGLI